MLIVSPNLLKIDSKQNYLYDSSDYVSLPVLSDVFDVFDVVYIKTCAYTVGVVVMATSFRYLLNIKLPFVKLCCKAMYLSLVYVLGVVE